VDDESIWHENETALRVFSASLGQWRMADAGPVGLDMPAVMLIAKEAIGVRRRSERRALWWPLQVMEAAAVDWFARRARQAQRAARA